MQTPRFIAVEDVVSIHEDQIASFGGTAGVRDQGLLESALAQPQATFGGKLLHPRIYEQSAAYLYHLAMNHPFIDGNKRMAFATMKTFILVNGLSLNLSGEQSYELVMQIATGKLSKDRLISYLEKAIVDSLLK